MMNSKNSSQAPLNANERKDEWSEDTRGERYIIRTTSEEANGAYSMLEVIADPRNGVPMHVHDNEEEHFIILEGKTLIANGDSRTEVGAGASITIGKGVQHAWCNPSEDSHSGPGVISFGHEQPLSFQIDRHVIDPPVHITKGDFGFELQRHRLRRLGSRITAHTGQRPGGKEQRSD
jgi:mannose-6-phosphate isomerase-like protein (cupin superfamily)